MLKYIGQRILASVPVLVVVVIAAFLLLHIAPGDPAVLIAGDQASPAKIADIRSELGLNRPLIEQLGIWTSHLVRGDLGRSIFNGDRVSTLIRQRAGPTLALGTFAELIAITLGVPLGVLGAWHRGTWIDRFVMLFAVLGFATPTFWLGYNFVFLFVLRLHWLPATGYEPLSAGPWPFVQHLILPATTLGIVVSALIARITRATMLDVLRQDYVRTARAKGLPELAVLLRHAARNAALPVITVIGFSIAGVLAGVAVIEIVFAIPGLGRLFVDAANNRDYPIVQGTILLTGVTFVLVNLLVDLTYVWIDPRVRY